jgi:hypothetical protein
VLPLLFDEGLPPAVAEALRCLDLAAWAIGEDGAPGRSTSDEINCQWCESEGAVLVTNDRGKKDRTIFDSIAQHHVHAIFVHNDLRTRPPTTSCVPCSSPKSAWMNWPLVATACSPTA